MKYSKGKLGGCLTDLVNDSGTVEMLEASAFKVIDMVFYFIGAIADRFYRLDCSSVSEVNSSYVDDINLLYKRGRRSGWTENAFQLISKTITEFETHAHKAFRISAVENEDIEDPLV